MTYPPIPKLDPDDSHYARCQVIDTIPVSPKVFFDWYWDEPAPNFMRGTLIVAPIIRVETLPGCTYGNPDEPIIYHFKDGTIAYEHVLKKDLPNGFSYQSWGYTSPLRVLTDYARVSLEARADGENRTKLVWTYDFHVPRRYLMPLARLFANYEWRKNLTGALKVIREHLEKHGAAKRIHQA
ncbi:MAG: hypothetical protein IPL47_06350 [Phyllobacteriaceae bacterium]|nr:hypothetical protein [Phyllobacteriaceae bacterium]